MEKKKIRIFETFAGIGSQYRAIKNIGLEPVATGYAEWFISAIISYETIHYGKMKPDTKTSVLDMTTFLSQYSFSATSKAPVGVSYWTRMNEKKLREIYPYLHRSVVKHNNKVDITKFDELPEDVDLLTYSFPCQDLSQQGKQAGISKGTRSGLLWEIERILNANKNNLPKYLVLENVMALVSAKFIDDLNEWIQALAKLGYYSEYQVLNAGNLGSAQNRRRVFMVSKLNDKNISWPMPLKTKKTLDKIIEPGTAPEINGIRKYKTDEVRTTKAGIKKQMLKAYSNFNSENYLYHTDGKGPTLTASGANSRLKIVDGDIIRYMTAREAYKYMGFRGTDYDKVASTGLITDTKAIFTCGNSISVEVLQELFKEMFDGQ